MKTPLFAWIWLALASVASAQSAAPTRFEVYSLGFADPQSAVEMVTAIAGPDGRVTPDEKNNRLLVIATEAQHKEIAQMMKRLATPPRNIQIEVAISSASGSRASEASVGASGQVVITPGGTSGKAVINPRFSHQTSTQSGFQNQMLMVGSGREASLRVGESVPYIDWIMEYGWKGGYITTQLNWQEVGSFLVVQPTVIGEGPEIRVRLIPEVRGVVNGEPRHVRFSSVQTEVIARDGETLSLGGLSGQNEFYQRFLIGRNKGGSTESLSIQLTPKIQ